MVKNSINEFGQNLFFKSDSEQVDRMFINRMIVLE